MRRLARNIGGARTGSGTINNKAGIKRVLISRPNNRLGNLLLITPLLQEVTETFPNCKIDLFVRGGLAPVLFKNYDNVDRIIQLPRKPFRQLLQYVAGWAALQRRRYDLVINTVNYSSSGRLSTQFARAEYKFFGDVNQDVQLRYLDHKHIAKSPVYNFRNYLAQLGLRENNKPIPPLDLRLSPEEVAEGRASLRELTGNDKNTICIFTYATGSKRYSKEWWETFHERLKTDFPEYNIIEVLPIENVSQISFKAPSFYSRDVRQIGTLIANTDIFIGADSGIMHLASAVHTPTVGLFSVSNPNVYRPYSNNSLSLNTNATVIDEWMRTIGGILSASGREEVAAGQWEEPVHYRRRHS